MTDEKALEIIVDFFNALEAACVNGKRQISELVNTDEKESRVPEQTFNLLKFGPQKGEKLGEFETAEKKNNIAQYWTHAFNILKAANATINNRYHGPEFVYSCWLYQDRIFRQKLNQK